jgi:threonine synthase
MCPVCGGILNIHYDLEKVGEELSRRKLKARPQGIWRYRELLPIELTENIVTLGEGSTFLHRCDKLAKMIGLRKLYLKNETTNPTGSFIDRGTAVEVSAVRERGQDSVCSASTGNLAASLVAYAARAGLRSKVFIGQRGDFDVGKFYQILAFAGSVEIVGSRKEAERRASQEAKHSYWVKSCNPYFMEGVKTTFFEVCEQLGWTTPDWTLIPMGNGGHLSMTWKGLNEFLEIELMSSSHAKLVGTQAKDCAPIADAFERGDQEIIASASGSTLAIDIGVKNPSCGEMALDAIRKSAGLAYAVSDSEILRAVKDLARLEGIFVEPASATTIASLRELVSNGTIDASETVVCIITGLGLKYPEIARNLVRGKGDLEQLLSRVEGRRFTTKLGQTKVFILTVLSENESYGYAIWQSLRENFGLRIKIPSVYQHLNELKASGLVRRTRSVQTIRKTTRNYYELTERGRLKLDQLEKLSS